MQISIQVDDKSASETSSKRGLPLCIRLKQFICRLSLLNIFTLFVLFAIIIYVGYLCKTYIRTLLFWLENQDSTVISICIIFLFTLVSLPISVGYLILVVADGYLFGMFNGLIVTVIGANAGICIAHNVLKLVAHHHTLRPIGENDMTKAIMRVIAGPLCFKIVFCARMTPIPFGLQNTIFALSNVNIRIYHIASFLGLLPAQTLAVYVGTTLRSMQDVFENRTISTGTYVLASIQLMMGASLMLWIGSKARKELLKALAEGEGKSQTKSAGNLGIV